MKVQLTLIGHSGSNHSVFYFYGATSAGLSSTPCYVTNKGMYVADVR